MNFPPCRRFFFSFPSHAGHGVGYMRSQQRGVQTSRECFPHGRFGPVASGRVLRRRRAGRARVISESSPFAGSPSGRTNPFAGFRRSISPCRFRPRRPRAAPCGRDSSGRSDDAPGVRSGGVCYGFRHAPGHGARASRRRAAACHAVSRCSRRIFHACHPRACIDARRVPGGFRACGPTCRDNAG